MSTSFESYSMYTPDPDRSRKRYDWCVFVKGGISTLGRISQVRYKLHPTFPNPIRITDDRNHRFALITNGWGGFLLSTTVTFTNGGTEDISFWVRLQDDAWPKKGRPQQFSTSEEERVYDVLAETQYRWRRLETIERRTGLEVSSVVDALERLECADLARKLGTRSIDQQEKWGATAIVGVMPRL